MEQSHDRPEASAGIGAAGAVHANEIVQSENTQHKQAEIARSQSDATLHQIAAQMPAHVWTTDTDLRVTSILGSGLSQVGDDPSRYIGRTLHELLGGDGLGVSPPVAAHLQALCGDAASYDLVIANGVFEARVEPLRDENDRIIGCVGLALDFSERLRAEETLRQSEERFRCLVQNSSDIITILDVEGGIRYESASVERVLGYKPDSIVGKNAFAFVHPDDLPRVMQAFMHVVQNPGSTLSVDYRFRHADNAWCFLESTGTNMLENLLVGGIVVNSRDITERKQAEQEHSLFASIVESSDDAIISMTLNGSIVSWNPGAARLYGYSADQVKGRHVSILVPPHQCDQVPDLLERIRQGERIDQYETVQVRNDGRQIYVSLSLSRIEDPGGNISGVSAIAHDIAERRELAIVEERERIAREMHDSLAQVLGYVNTKAQAAEELLRRGQPDRAAAQLAQLAEAARDAYADVREHILGLRTSLGPHRLLLDTLRDYLNSWQKQSGIQAEMTIIPSDACTLDLPPAAELQLMRIIQEALANVRKHSGANKTSIRLGERAGWVEVLVQDDGLGFDGVPLSRDGLPHFGLATMRERAEAVGGTLEVESAAGRGTRIRVRLPAASIVASVTGGHAHPDS